jgi:hypothetical protein
MFERRSYVRTLQNVSRGDSNLKSEVCSSWSCSQFSIVSNILSGETSLIMSAFSFVLCLVLALSFTASGLPSVRSRQRDNNATQQSLPYSLPNHDSNPTSRAAETQSRREGFQYGSAVAAGPFSAAGSLGEAANKDATAVIMAELAGELEFSNSDYAKANATEAKVRILEYTTRLTGILTITSL